MEYWWVYLLTFLFGYVTHKTFYFLRAARLSLSLVKASHVIYLSLIVKAVENFVYAKTSTILQMKENGEPREQIRKFEHRHDEDVILFKERSIAVLLEYHPAFFRSMVEFEDWPSAMRYLMVYREAALKFWEVDDDQ
jgi:hypothetical protein